MTWVSRLFTRLTTRDAHSVAELEHDFSEQPYRFQRRQKLQSIPTQLIHEPGLSKQLQIEQLGFGFDS